MKKLVFIALALFSVVSCIENDLPYPLLVPSVTELEVEDAIETRIDNTYKTISIVLAEQADEASVKIKNAKINPETTKANPLFVGTHDLSKSQKIRLTTWPGQNYDWTLSAIRPIERYFTVKGQIGAPVIDEKNHRAVAFVSIKADLSNIEVTSLKLGPRDISTIVPSIAELKDFQNGVQVKVSWKEKSETWDLYVEQKDVTVTLNMVSPWSKLVWLSASGIEGEKNGFLYKEKDATDWIDVEAPEGSSGEFTVCIEDLKPSTDYVCVAYSGEDKTAEKEFTTDPEAQLPNSGFETFSKAESENYFCWYDPSSPVEELKTKWWDSGNIGSTTVGAAYAIALPDSDCTEGKVSACLVSRNVIIKFAAGNTFSGEFAGLVGTQGGICNFGRPFTLRPRKLTLSLKYQCGKIDCIGSVPEGQTVSKGDNDRCQVWIALGDWDYKKYGGTRECPVQVNTTIPSTAFRADGESVIAYGSYVLSKSTDGWIEVEIPLDYRSVTRRPTHIIVSAASSILGDYFTGSSTSILWLDDLKLEY